MVNWIEEHPYKSSIGASILVILMSLISFKVQGILNLNVTIFLVPFVFIINFAVAGCFDFSEYLKKRRDK